MTIFKSAIAAAVAITFATGAFAQTGTSPTTTTPGKPPVTAGSSATTGTGTATTPKVAKEKKPRTEISMACSKQADEKQLKGAPRKTFRTKCMKDAEKAAKATGLGASTTSTSKPATDAAKKN